MTISYIKKSHSSGEGKQESRARVRKHRIAGDTMARQLPSFLFRAARLNPSQGAASVLLLQKKTEQPPTAEEKSNIANSDQANINQASLEEKAIDNKQPATFADKRSTIPIASLINPIKEEFKDAGAVIDEVYVCLNHLSILLGIASTKKNHTFIYDADLVSSIVAKGNEQQWRRFCDAALGVLLVVFNLSQVSKEKTMLSSITAEITASHELLRASFEDALSAYSSDERNTAESNGLGAVHKIMLSISQLVSELKGEQIRLVPSRPLTARDLGMKIQEKRHNQSLTNFC